MILRAILAELATPSGKQTPHHRATTGIAHAVLGAVPVAYLGLWGLPLGLMIGAVYWLAKERGDLKRGGALWDGLEDALMVCLGAWYAAPWWPAMLIGAGGYLMAVGVWRDRV